MDKMEKKGIRHVGNSDDSKPKAKKKHLAFDIVLEVFALFITTTYS